MKKGSRMNNELDLLWNYILDHNWKRISPADTGNLGSMKKWRELMPPEKGRCISSFQSWMPLVLVLYKAYIP